MVSGQAPALVGAWLRTSPVVPFTCEVRLFTSLPGLFLFLRCGPFNQEFLQYLL